MAQRTRAPEPDKFIVRFPDGMRDTLARRARDNGRSMNSELIQILKREFGAQQAA